jgi:hypothetical protein
MDVIDRIFQLLGRFLIRIGAQMLAIFVDRLGDDVKIQRLAVRGFWNMYTATGFPAAHSAASPRPRGHCPWTWRSSRPFIQEQLVDILHRRLDAQDPADLRIDRRIGLVVLAEHLEIHAQRGPAHAEIRLPLQLHMPAGDRQGDVGPVLIVERDRAGLGVDGLHRHIEHVAGFGEIGRKGE